MANSHVDLLSLYGSVNAKLDVERDRRKETKVELLFHCANNIEQRVISACLVSEFAGSKPARAVAVFLVCLLVSKDRKLVICFSVRGDFPTVLTDVENLNWKRTWLETGYKA